MMKYEVAVVGGGVAGLTAAIYAAKAGKRTIVIEKQDRLGGRAVSNKKKGAYFNLGGHALYHGDALATFRELGLRLQGNQPSIDGYGIWKGKLLTMPMGIKSLLATPLLTWKGKMELASWLVKLGKLDTHRYDQISLRDWIEGHLHDPMVRNLFYALLRTASYVAAPDMQAAGPVLQQLQHSLQGVLYLDRGWGAVIDELREMAAEHGVKMLTSSKVVAIEHRDGAVQHVRCEDDTRVEAKHIVITAPPAVAHRLVPNAESTALHAWREQAIEITAACLDVALRRLPRPKQQFVYGIDQTVFLSNQSRAAYLSDDGAQVISVIKYQGEDTNPDTDLRDLEQTLDLVQPGWRDELVAKQYLPRITVCHDFLHMGRQHQPGPAVPEIAGLYVAGEWASHGELLVDAATASAKRAVQYLLSREETEGKPQYAHRDIV
ncbi:phytoene dehydrogenase-like protein [Paenibacillus harenae]|uniref:Phytoene dehydrogenase-like protein n=2 Tax=Paenibacillus harenae TaxID=306543 RepID=A0ABT9U0X3_PAEHA|nr:FAD-dependent oxidoreductase [Paenibacillus harenae]MDQ0060406.1 phytoene dehydrogenase-like protein [Paenibacillus harenae]MDQ0112079.1 phytoene dehydrogenase-like protein [Paenibacillus harenae]